jgi:hypothetical protein
MPRFIITDPCYVMDDKLYDAICRDFDCRFEDIATPITANLANTTSLMLIHMIKDTPHGDGSCTFDGQEVGVDSGMLCIAELVKDDWDKNNNVMGAMFDTLDQAKESWTKILSKF